jgi:hypothetical protein
MTNHIQPKYVAFILPEYKVVLTACNINLYLKPFCRIKADNISFSRVFDNKEARLPCSKCRPPLAARPAVKRDCLFTEALN